jgi:hypothetical protein
MSSLIGIGTGFPSARVSANPAAGLMAVATHMVTTTADAARAKTILRMTISWQWSPTSVRHLVGIGSGDIGSKRRDPMLAA